MAAPAGRVWGLVSNLPDMGAYSPENNGGRWQDGSGAQVGAVFRGRNSTGRRRWSTRSVVTRWDPEVALAFDVSAGGLPVAAWSYELAPTAGGCAVTETWQDRRGTAMRILGRLTTGVSDRESFTASSIEQTLQRLKARAEQDSAV